VQCENNPSETSKTALLGRTENSKPSPRACRVMGAPYAWLEYNFTYNFTIMHDQRAATAQGSTARYAPGTSRDGIEEGGTIQAAPHHHVHAVPRQATGAEAIHVLLRDNVRSLVDAVGKGDGKASPSQQRQPAESSRPTFSFCPNSAISKACKKKKISGSPGVMLQAGFFARAIHRVLEYIGEISMCVVVRVARVGS
jgi:hypothetical protein